MNPSFGDTGIPRFPENMYELGRHPMWRLW